jgi:hypothetical protein
MIIVLAPFMEQTTVPYRAPIRPLFDHLFLKPHFILGFTGIAVLNLVVVAFVGDAPLKRGDEQALQVDEFGPVGIIVFVHGY